MFNFTPSKLQKNRTNQIGAENFLGKNLGNCCQKNHGEVKIPPANYFVRFGK